MNCWNRYRRQLNRPLESPSRRSSYPAARLNLIKTVVQTVVQEEDRSKNSIIFGLPEQKNEELNKEFCGVLQTIGEKPRIEAWRIGRQRFEKKIRPVTVTAACSTVIIEIPARSRCWHLSEKFKAVFISPDRSPEQRAKQRELVKEIKTEQPDKVHLIRNGTIISTDRTNRTVKWASRELFSYTQAISVFKMCFVLYRLTFAY